MARIGITGGIGSGKSTVSRYLESKGFLVLDADRIARELTGPGAPLTRELAVRFGDGILDEAGELDRARLAAIVFADPYKKQVLEQLLHGQILDEIRYRLQTAGDRLAFVDAALLLEAGWAPFFDSVWVVTADREERIRRVTERDGWTAADIEARMRNQMPDEERLARADRVLWNTGNKEMLYRQVDELLNEWDPTLLCVDGSRKESL